MHGRSLYRNGMATCNHPNRRFLRRWLDNSMDGTKVGVENRESFPPCLSFFFIYIYKQSMLVFKTNLENQGKSSNFGIFEAVPSCFEGTRLDAL